MVTVKLKAYGDFHAVTANPDGTRTTRVGKQVILTEIVADGRVVAMPRMVIQHGGNVLAVPVCTKAPHGMSIRFDRWQLFDMARQRMLPGEIETLDPRGGMVADIALRYVLEARHLADDVLVTWMSAALATARLETFA